MDSLRFHNKLRERWLKNGGGGAKGMERPDWWASLGSLKCPGKKGRTGGEVPGGWSGAHALPTFPRKGGEIPQIPQKILEDMKKRNTCEQHVENDGLVSGVTSTPPLSSLTEQLVQETRDMRCRDASNW